MTAEPSVKLLPFHESVIVEICCASTNDSFVLAKLIRTTKIQKGHDDIIAAWNRRAELMGWGEDALGVPTSLLKQKEESRAVSASSNPP